MNNYFVFIICFKKEGEKKHKRCVSFGLKNKTRMTNGTWVHREKGDT